MVEAFATLLPAGILESGAQGVEERDSKGEPVIFQILMAAGVAMMVVGTVGGVWVIVRAWRALRRGK